MTDTKTEYYFSKIAIFLTSILLLAILFLFALVTYVLYLANLKIAMSICLFVCLLFLTTFPSFYRRISLFLTCTPALVLTRQGLIDNINSQIFKWKDIKNISSPSIKITTRVNYIEISLVDPDKYIDTIGNPYKRLIARLNQKYFRGAFSIPANIIKCDNAELLKSLVKYLDENE